MKEIDQVFDKAEDKILKITSEMVSSGEITAEEAGEINSLARNGEFVEAKELIETLREQQDALDFDNEEKELFAEAFSESFQELKENIEEMKDTLKKLENGASRKDLKQYLYGENSSRTHKEIDNVFDAIDDFNSKGASNKKIAKVLTAFNTNLTISQTEKMVDEIRAKVNK